MNAYDDASDAAYAGGGNFHGLNGGTGFGAWDLIFQANTGLYGAYVGSSNNNGGGGAPGIDTAGSKAWGLYANSGNGQGAYRPFNAALSNTDIFSFEMDNGYVDTDKDVYAGVFLGGSFVGVFFLGGSSTYILSDEYNVNQTDTGIGFTDGGLIVSIGLDGLGNYKATVKRKSDGLTFNHTALSHGQDIDAFYAQSSSPGSGPPSDFFINKMQIVPEPGSIIAIGAGLGCLLSRRRRR